MISLVLVSSISIILLMPSLLYFLPYNIPLIDAQDEPSRYVKSSINTAHPETFEVQDQKEGQPQAEKRVSPPILNWGICKKDGGIWCGVTYHLGNCCYGGQVCDDSSYNFSCNCPVSGQVLIGRQCQCPSGQHVDLGLNTCVPDCTGGKINDPQTGACTCPAGEIDCSGNCVDILNDDANCGTCENNCSGGQSCQIGTCQCPSATPHLINGQCQKCPEGQVPGIGTDADKCVRDCSDLGSGYQYCSNWGQCVDTSSTNTDCGVCGNQCDAGLSCIDGGCSPTVQLCQPRIIDGQQVGCQSCSTGNNVLCQSCISVVGSCS